MFRQATCACANISLLVSEEPLRVSLCHCHACQRRTSSAFGYQARFSARAVQINGTCSEYVRTADSGNAIHFFFCPQCGSTVYYRYADVDDVIVIPAGMFADSLFPAPGVSVYNNRKHDWLELPDGIELWK